MQKEVVYHIWFHFSPYPECSVIGVDMEPVKVVLEYCSPATRSLDTLCQVTHTHTHTHKHTHTHLTVGLFYGDILSHSIESFYGIYSEEPFYEDAIYIL